MSASLFVKKIDAKMFFGAGKLMSKSSVVDGISYTLQENVCFVQRTTSYIAWLVRDSLQLNENSCQNSLAAEKLVFFFSCNDRYPAVLRFFFNAVKMPESSLDAEKLLSESSSREF